MRSSLALWSVLGGLLLPAPGRASSAAEVGQAIADRRSRVAELRVIKEAAEELGIRVWLFGGTAAGFAHYVRWDLAREAGDSRYRDTFFDYDFTNIYRSTQDADLVVDATPAQAERLENLVRQKMSFLQGSKEHWEVRLLRQDRVAPGGQVKQALLHNPDFLGQHTDSNSTGMIELTDPPPGESVVRDLRDWDSSEPFFLKDVTEGRLHYYWSPTHQETSRYLSGDNPELFSVIRYLVKAFQYDLAVEGEDLARVQAIIDAFDPQRDHASMSPWAKGWLERYGPNLIRHSVNIEYAWNTLERSGLRQKLISLSDPSRQKTVGWWLSREPLRTHAVGEGQGKTAAELGIEVVAHETSDFLAYESITRDTTLRPNVLISRPGYPGEAAALGPGFYTRLGRSGARGTGLTIRFRVDPTAREGTDFTVQGDFVLFTNRAALRVIPESLQATWPQYFQMLREGVIDPSDRGAWMKLKRRLSLRGLTPEEERAVLAVVLDEIDRLGREAGSSAILQEWFALPAAEKHAEVVDSALHAAVQAAFERTLFDEERLVLLKIWYHRPASRDMPLSRKVEERIVSAASLRVDGYSRDGEGDLYWKMTAPWRQIVWDWLSLPLFQAHPEAFELLFTRRSLSRLDLPLLPEWLDDSRFMLAAISNTAADDRQAGERFQAAEFDRVLQEPRWRLNPRLRGLCGGKDPETACLRSGMARELAEEAGSLTTLGPARLSDPYPALECP